MATLLDDFKSLTRYWWAMLIIGIAIIVAGVFVFMYPGESYLSMAIVFAVLMVVSGILDLVIAFTEKYLSGRGWIAVSGAIELILGIMLLANPAVSAMVLPFILGFWLIFRGISLIGIASEMRALNIPGMGWSIALGILLIICALVILFNPIVYGVAAVVITIGIALLVAGVSMSVFSFQLLSIKNRFRNMIR